MSTTPALDPAWHHLIDDAAMFSPRERALTDALTAYAARRTEWYAALVSSFVVSDVDLPALTAAAQAAPSDAGPVRACVVVTGGAGAVPGALRLLAKAPTVPAGLEIALRDLDDLTGSARRVAAAVAAVRGDGALDDETPVYVELPAADPTAAWLAAADEVAAAELRLKFRTGGTRAHQFPGAATVATWMDAALDRETPFKCTAGLHHAVRHRDPATGFEHHGFLNLLLATRAAFDGAGAPAVADLLEDRRPDVLAASAREADLAGARRWFTSFGSCSVSEPLADLVALGLLRAPGATEPEPAAAAAGHGAS